MVQWSSHIPETCTHERYQRTSFNVRGPGRLTIYTVKQQQHISAVEKKLKEIIWKIRENK